MYSSCLHDQQDLCWGNTSRDTSEEPQNRKRLVKNSAQGHNWNPPEMALLFSEPHKIFARAAAKRQKYHVKTLFHQLISGRSSGIFICTRKSRYQSFFCKKQHVFIFSRFGEIEI